MVYPSGAGQLDIAAKRLRSGYAGSHLLAVKRNENGQPVDRNDGGVDGIAQERCLQLTHETGAQDRIGCQGEVGVADDDQSLLQQQRSVEMRHARKSVAGRTYRSASLLTPSAWSESKLRCLPAAKPKARTRITGQ
jgi:hypothetical protein